jgi:hypothetical protein
MPPSSVHFNGSVNLPDAETVMRQISSRIPTGVRRMTDGETGERGYWIHFQIQKFLAMPEFESVSVGKAYETGDADAPDMPQLRLADGVSAEAVSWPNLGYADAYSESFKLFSALQEEGTIAAGVRFQMQYPTPLASIAVTIAPEDMPGVAAAYEAVLFSDLDEALTRIPHDRCAVQWDVAVEFGALEGQGAARAGRARADSLRGPRPRRRPGRTSPLLRGLRPSAFQAAGIARNAGRARERGRLRREPPDQLVLVHRAAVAERRGTTSRRCATSAWDPRPSCTSRSSRTTPPTSPRAQRPGRCG